MSHDFEHKVRERAYHLWHKEGCPDGREQEFWERARLLQQAEDAPRTTPQPQAVSAEEQAVDEAGAESFPASDPPAFAAPPPPASGRSSRKRSKGGKAG